MIERTLLFLKPDGVYRSLIGKVISQIEDAGLKVVAMKMVWPDKKIAGVHYADDPEWFESVGKKTLASYKEKGIETKESAVQIGARIRTMLITLLTSGPIVPMVIEGNDAIFIVRKLVGVTEPKKAESSTIRGRYSTDSYGLADAKGRPILNIVHASEDQKTAEREIAIWFKKGEILEYKNANDSMMH